MPYRIQKTIISKYLELVNQEFVTKEQIEVLLSTVEHLYRNQTLTSIDIYRQKLEIITSNLISYLETIQTSRKFTKLQIDLNQDIYQILKHDLEGIDYHHTDLGDLDKFDNEKTLPISLQNVKQILENLIVAKRFLTYEKDFEDFIANQLTLIYGKERVHKQYSVGGFLGLKTDIDVGNGQVGIELKIADNLKATDMQRMIGQVVYYKKRFYDNNLIVLIGSETTVNATTSELMKFIEELGITVIFISAVSTRRKTILVG